MNTEKIHISLIKSNPNNPRVIKDDKFKNLVKSIQEFPEMLEIRPIVVDDSNTVLGGNMRLKALQELGYKVVSIVRASSLTEEQKQEFIIKDNVGYGEWDWETLANDWDPVKLEEWGLDVPNFESSDDDLSEKIHETFKIEISCLNETHQEKTYNELIGKGYNCRLLSL